MRNTIIFILISICIYILVHTTNGKPVQVMEVISNTTSDQEYPKLNATSLEAIVNYLLEMLQGNQTHHGHHQLLSGNFSAENLTRLIEHYWPLLQDELIPPPLEGFPINPGYGYPHLMYRYVTSFRNGSIISTLNGHAIPAEANNLNPEIDGSSIVDNYLDFVLDCQPVVIENDYLHPGLDGLRLRITSSYDLRQSIHLSVYLFGCKYDSEF